MKKTTMTNRTLNSKVVRAGAILSAMLMVLLPSTGVGNFASVAYATTNDQDTSLTTFTVDGTAVSNGSVVNVDYGTTAVDVVATPNNADATVDITGDTGLETGANTVSVLVTAADDVTTQTYSVTVNVGQNNDTSLGVFTVNGDDVSNGATVNLSYGTTEVEVLAEPSDVEATVVISGDTELETGDNSLQVTVTAADGETTQSYTVTLAVAENNDASLAVFAVNEDDVTNGATVNLDYGTTSVDVIAEPTDVEATVVISGGTELETGDNTLQVTVTAADGETTQSYSVTLRVAENNDASLAVFAVNEDDVTNGATVNLDYGTTSVDVIAEPTDVEATVVVSGNQGLSTGSNTLTVTVTAADGTTVETYTVTLQVAANSDTSLAVFAVNGDDVTDGGTVTVANGTTEVTVIADPTDPDAVALVTGATGLSTGNNTLTVDVTAASGATAKYTVTIVVSAPAFSNDTSLKTFKIDGSNVSDGASITIAQGRTSVSVEAVPNDIYATATTAGNTNLQAGANTVTVTVTADDGTVKVYTVTVTVAVPSSDTSLSSVKIDGNNFTVLENGSSVYDASFGTTKVTVSATPTSGTATVSVTGDTNLVTGQNTVTISVLAEDGTTKDYTFKVAVAAANTNTDISSFQINGSNVTAGDTVDLPYGTTDVSVDVETAATTSTFTVSGGSSLTTGTSSLVVTVTAQSGAIKTYTVTLNVLEASSVKDFTSITVNGVAVSPENTVTLNAGTTEISVIVNLVSPFGSYSVSGSSTVSTGTNTRTVTITAQDGSTADTGITIIVPEASTNNELQSLIVDEVETAVNAIVEKPVGTTSVNVIATPASDKATVTVSGEDVLVPGLNTVTITVTAESGASATYTFKVNVAKSSNTDVTSILIDNTEVSVSKAITIGFGATDVEVSAVTADPNASYTVSGNTGLTTGTNDVTVTVTAANGSTKDYVIVVTVPSVDSNTALDELKVNGITISAGDIVEKPFGTDAVSVTATAVSTRATVTVSGEDVLVPGSNTVTVTITAESGATATYTFTVKVAKSNNVALTSVLVDNQEVLNTTAYTTGYGATSVEVSAVTADPNASYTVSGNTNLQVGTNTVTVDITAADGVTTSYLNIVVTVPVASSNTLLQSVTIAGYEVSTSGGSLSEVLPNGTSSVEVVAVAADSNSTVVVSGDTGLVTGLNTVTVTVTAESGASSTYEFSVIVAQSSNKEVSSILVDNNEVSVTKALTVGIGVTDVTVTAVLVDAEASYSVSGNTDLEAGANDVVVTVVAGDGSSKQYVIVVTVPSADTNNALDTLVVDNATIAAGDTLERPYGTESVEVVATAVSQKATVLVSGADALIPGTNTVTVTITSESGATATYTFTVVVAKSSDKSLGSITVNGKSVNVEDTIIVSGDTTSVTVIAFANDPEATVSVSGADELELGDNTVTVTITAADGSSADYVFTVRVPSPSNNANLSFFTVNGVDAIENSVIEVVSDVTEAVIILQTESSNASYEITGGTALLIGNNEISVVVTSQDQSTSRTYTVTVKRAAPLSSDTTLDSITVNNTTISAGDVFDVANGTESVEVVATPNDDKATVLVTGATGLKTGDNLVSILVTAENGATAEYSFTVKVALSGDNSLASISVNGSSVSLDDLNVTVASGTSSVVVSATPSDVDASYTVSGADALEYGANEVTITVTAANGDQRTYTLNVTRTPLSGNNNIGLITVNGTTVAVDGTFEVDPGTESVEVVATAEDTDASVAISDSNALVAGNNVITITVTAANGTEATYEINVFVKSLSNDATLKTFTIDGNAVEDGGEVTLDGTKNFVAVVAQANDAGAVVTIEGSTNLEFGSNDVVVTVTAEDGTVAIYTVTVNFPNLGDTSLKTFTVNGTAVEDGDRVELEYGVTDVEVVVETTSPDATFEVTGADSLVSGENQLVVTVTAVDGETIQEYVVVLFVAFNTDSSLSSFQVNGEDVEDGDVIDLPAYTTEVEVTAEPTDPDATVEINGATELSVGENLLIVTVTAADGVSATDYVITLNVPLGNNVELSTFTVNGNDAADGDVLDLDPYTTSVEVVVETVDPDATFVVVGGTDLQVGANTLTVTVTAADETATATYTVTLNVPLGNNVELATFQINGNDVENEATVDVEYGTTEVDITVVTVDEDATFEVVGGTDLQPGENTITITVTAADGETTATYTVTVNVALNTDTSLGVFAVNGTDVIDGDTIDLAYGVTSVEVLVEPTDPAATFEIEGGTDLVSGENTLTVTVTAADGETVEVYTITLNVAFNSDTSLSVFQINGTDVVDGASVNLPAYTTEVEVTAEPTDPDATVEIEGGTELVSGENTLTVTVTAADKETTDTYTITLVVALGNDVTLATFQVNGEDVEDGGSLDLEPLTTSVEVVVETTDPDATFVVEGNSDLKLGANTLTVVVTAADGSVTATYTVTLNIPLNNDVTLSQWKVNGVDAADGETVEVEYGTTEVEVSVTTNDPLATYVISGGTGVSEVEGVTLVSVGPGENTVTVTVTAQDQSTGEYSVTVLVKPNSDTSLATFTLNGEDVNDGDVFDLEYGVTEVEVIALPTDPDATVEIAGNTDLVSGENTVTVTVTAADGETVGEYVLTLNVAFNSDTSLGSFQVNGEDVEDGAVIDLPPYTTEVEVTAEPTDPDATVEINGATELSVGENLLIVTVTAADGVSATDYVITLNVPLGNDVTLATFQVNGEDVEDGGSLDLPPLTTSVEVTVETTDPDATFVVTGDTGLEVGANVLTVAVTAADGETIADYTVTLNVPLNNDASLATFQVNGEDVEDGATVEVEFGTTEVPVVATATDANATVVIVGGTELQTGENTIVVTVTAEDGETVAEYTVTVIVKLSSDTTLSEFTVNGNPVDSGDYVELELGTTSVEVVVVTTDEGATYEIEGGADLQPGENTLTVTVTAADGETTQEYVVTLFVLLSDDTSLSTFKINGVDVEDGSDLELPAYTAEVEVEAVATNADAQVEVSGADSLQPGENRVEVTVTAADGETVQLYTVFVTVLISTETRVSEILVNGVSAVDGDVVLSTDLELTEVEVEVTTVDENSTVEIVGNTELVKGDNLITITVTAPSGDVSEYTVTFRLGGLPGNAKLKSLVVAGSVIDLTLSELAIEVRAGVRNVSVIPTAEDEAASIRVTGNTNLVTGENLVTVTVKAADGKTVREYIVKVNVLALSSNTKLSSIKVNGTTVAAGGTFTLVPGAKSAEVVAVAEEADSSVSYSGTKNLSVGNNTVTITVRAADGSTASYTVTLVSPALSSDVSLKTFVIEGFNVLSRTKLSVPAGTTKLRVTAQATDSAASVSISGRDIKPGVNFVVVTVTAADGTVATYTVRVKA